MGNTSLSTADRTGDHVDVREAGRLVASALLAAGPVMPALVERANHGLARLTLLPLAERDFVIFTPEELAPLMPPQLRGALADLLLELAGEEPLRRRMAHAYLGLWKLGGRAPAAPSAEHRHASHAANVTERVARTVIGNVPRHQGVSIPEERVVYQVEAYRSVDEEARRAPPVVDPLRARVARVRSEMLEVIAAVDRVVIGKHDVVTRVLTAMAARGHVLLVDSALGATRRRARRSHAGDLAARGGQAGGVPHPGAGQRPHRLRRGTRLAVGVRDLARRRASVCPLPTRPFRSRTTERTQPRETSSAPSATS